MGIRLLKKAKSENFIGNYIPFSHHVTDEIVATKNADYAAVFKIEGRSHQGASLNDVFQWAEEVNNAIIGMASDKFSLWGHIVRRKLNEEFCSSFEDSFSKNLDEKYSESLSNCNMMANDIYLTVVYKNQPDKVMAFFAKHEKESYEEKILRKNNAVKEISDSISMIGSVLKEYDGRLLSTYDKNGYLFSEPLEFFSLLVNGEYSPVPILQKRFSDYISQNRISFSNWGEVGEIHLSSGARKKFGIAEIADYPARSEPGHLNRLLESNFEFILTQSFSILSMNSALDYLKRHKRNLVDSNDVAVSQVEQIDDAMDALVSKEFVMGEHHATLTVFGDTVKEVKEHISKARVACSEVAIMVKPVDLATESAFWAQMPANWAYRPRPAPITSLNFVSFFSMHNFAKGKKKNNPWGDAVTTLKTVSGTPYYMNFHDTPVGEISDGKKALGNTMIIGQSGSGKSVLLGFLISQSQRFKPTVVVFDKDRGLNIIVKRMGGCYLPLKMGEKSGFNPLQVAPTPSNIIFLKSLIKKIISSDNQPVSFNDEKEIDNALRAVMSGSIEKAMRRLSTLLQFLPNPTTGDINERPSVHARLLKWCAGGEYGWLFDNEEDSLDLEKYRLYGFDVTEFLDTPEVRTPLMMYLLFRTEDMIDGRNFMYIFDEFWKPLQDPYFQDLAKNKQKTIRKENGIFVFATQEPSDALNSEISNTLVQQCATYIFLANPSAHHSDYVDGFKLTDSQFDVVKNLNKNDRRFMIKQGDSSVVAELNLAGFDDELVALSGTPENAEIMDEIINEVGDDPDVWYPMLLKEINKGRK